ncbi:hypothetical protein [Caulobacter sp. UC70_42]|uniref:hypothetical protein n=1 Tax=Caulobacter sp. UC70_42 TaxID=3374551 RepID=UPI003757CA3F
MLGEKTFALTEADLDHMHHALGRPVGPHVVPYRNYFATSTESPDAKRFEEIGLWVKGQGVPGGLTYYHVNDEGQRRVWSWLSERNRKDGLRAYAVSGGGLIATKTVMAKSRSAAKYAVWLEFSDVVDFGYGEWLSRGPRVRLAA